MTNFTNSLLKDDVVSIQKTNLILLNRLAKNLPLKVGRVRSQWSGGYVAPFKGRGMEFDEVRPYQPGDEIRNLDWRVMARTGKPYTKLYREERERSILVWVDLNTSMFFSTHQAYKSVIASYIASLLAWSAVHHGDRVGGLLFSEQQHLELRPRRGKKSVLYFIQQLVDHPAWLNSKTLSDSPAATANEHETSTNQAIHRLHHVSNPGSLIFMISDFRGLTEQTHASIQRIARHNDVVMIFISDPLESELPPQGLYRICDNQANAFTLDTSNTNFRKTFQQHFEQRKNEITDLCHRYGMFFLPISTEQNIVTTLQNGLGLKR